MKKIFVLLAVVMIFFTGCGSENDSSEVIIVGLDESPLDYDKK